MSLLIAGGSGSGKSMLAQRIVRAMPAPRWYVATMIPVDQEDHRRIARHRAEREGWGFGTLEQGRDILRALDAASPGDSFLIDSATALLAGEMFPPQGFCPGAGEKVAEELARFVTRAPNTVVVMDIVFHDARRYDAYTDAYIRALGQIGCRLAQVCDCVVEVSAGVPQVFKGALPLLFQWKPSEE